MRHPVWSSTASEERLAALDQKLDHLTSQVDACLSSIRSLPGIPLSAGHGGAASYESGGSQRRTSRNSAKCSSKGSSVFSPFLEARPWRVSLPLSRSAEQSQVGSSDSQGLPPRVDALTPASSWSKGRAGAHLMERGVGHVESRIRRLSVGSFDLFMSQRWRKLSPRQQLVWAFLSNPESGLAARVYNRLNPAFILLVVGFSLIQMTPSAVIDPDSAMLIECAIEAVFLLEISVLFIVCPSRWHFFLRCYNIIDIASVMPLVLRLHSILTEDGQDIYTLVFGGLVPVVRLLKTLRRFQTSRLLTSAFLLAQEAIPVLIFYYAVVWLLFSAIVFAVEDSSNVSSLPDAMWLSFVSMTTLGYGDVVPKSGAGRLVVAGFVMISSLYMAIPLGIIGSCFSAVWADRDCILLFERLRSCFMEIGCSHWDVPQLFSLFDKTKTGSLDALEFMELASHLKLGLSEDRIMRLFEFWANEDDGNRIGAAEFQKTLFPTTCVKELAKQTREDFTWRRKSTQSSFDVMRSGTTSC